jgi:RNA polymerase-associated protein LEO1
MWRGFIQITRFWQDEENDNHYSSRRMASRGRFEDDLEAEAQAERRIINAKKVSNWAKKFPRLN